MSAGDLAEGRAAHHRRGAGIELVVPVGSPGRLSTTTAVSAQQRVCDESGHRVGNPPATLPTEKRTACRETPRSWLNRRKI